MKKTSSDIAQLTDLEIIALYKSNDQNDLVGTLYKRYMSLVYGVCLKYLKDREPAKDMTMQVFEKLLTNLKSQQIQNFKSWIYVLTKNECLMLLRKNTRQNGKTESINDHQFMEFNIPQHHIDESPEEDIGKLDSCIEKLGKAQQECIKLFYLEKKCYQEVCEITGHEMKKVKSYLQNGRRNLKLCIEKLREREEQPY